MSTRRKRGRPPASRLDVPWLKRKTDFARYAAAKQMDVADWYVNLELRSLIARTGDVDLARFIRENPIVRRGDAHGFEFELLRTRLSPDARAILAGRQPSGGVQPLRVDELYLFEQRLPASIREAGRAFVPGRTRVEDVPREFVGALDDAMDPPLLGRFARVDLSLPDRVLVDEFRAYLVQQREHLARLGIEAPYSRAIEQVEHRYDPRTQTWARLNVLPLLDVQAWLRETGATARPMDIARLLGTSSSDHQQAVEYARVLTDDFALRGWLLSAARAALRA